MADSVWDELLRGANKPPVSFDYVAVARSLEHKAESVIVAKCAVAVQFELKMTGIIFLSLGTEPSRGQIAQAKYLLQEQWQVWRRSLPFDHKSQTTVAFAPNHACLDYVYHEAYENLHLLELALRPSSKIITDYDELVKSSEETAKQTIAGIVIADEVEE